VVIRVIICALLWNSPSSSFSLLLSSPSFFAGAELATSFRTSVFANRIELSCTRRRTWNDVVEIDQSWPETKYMSTFAPKRPAQ
jgi:hypothetical protein